jgi:hypothetical protein
MSPVSADLPHWPHHAVNQQLRAPEQERSSTMIEISIHRSLFLPQMLFIIINQYYSQPTKPTSVYFSISTASAYFLSVYCVVFTIFKYPSGDQLFFRNLLPT